MASRRRSPIPVGVRKRRPAKLVSDPVGARPSLADSAGSAVDGNVESEKPVTYYCRRNDKDNRFTCEVAFHHVEMRLWLKGPEDYLLMICREPVAELTKAGAIPPFEFSCMRTGVGEIYMLVVGEI